MIFRSLDEIVLAYATSVHKYQGSECPCVVIPIHTSHFKLLHRNLALHSGDEGQKTGLSRGDEKSDRRSR